jgi:CBS domain-containing membrane protein
MSNLYVRDLMSEKVHTIEPSEDLEKLYELMEDYHIRHVPVVNANGELEGIVSNRDLVKNALFADGELPLSQRQNFLESITVESIMTKDPEVIEPDQKIQDAGNIMLENKISCLPVTENDKVVGIITEADFVKFVLSEY